MPHQIAYKRLSRTDGHRKALLRNLATALFKYEKIETNGSITPDDALSTAASIMQEELDLFVSFTNRSEPLPETPPNEWDIPVETLNLSVRSFNCLKRAGISKVSELLDLTEDEIMKMRNFGKKSLDEIKQVLAERGLSLRQA